MPPAGSRQGRSKRDLPRAPLRRAPPTCHQPHVSAPQPHMATTIMSNPCQPLRRPERGYIARHALQPGAYFLALPSSAALPARRCAALLTCLLFIRSTPISPSPVTSSVFSRAKSRIFPAWRHWGSKPVALQARLGARDCYHDDQQHHHFDARRLIRPLKSRSTRAASTRRRCPVEVQESVVCTRFWQGCRSWAQATTFHACLRAKLAVLRAFSDRRASSQRSPRIQP